MLIIIKLIELFIFIAIIRVLIGVVFPGTKRNKPTVGKSTGNKRFDSKDADISDGEYKDIR